jgi:hypothetical protein
VGYGTKEIGVNGMAEINVVLNESAELLDEIVVIGYGSQRKSDFKTHGRFVSNGQNAQSASCQRFWQLCRCPSHH